MQPRYYQQGAHDAFWDYLNNETGNPLIVIPTGGGKSLIIAMTIRTALSFGARVLVLQHRKELVTQNLEKVNLLLPGCEVGIHSASLGERAVENDVIGCGIQSVHTKAHLFGARDLVLIDEVHLVGKAEGMYGRFLKDLQDINPGLRVGGLTATPYRTGEGPICGTHKTFQRICYEVQTGDLIKEGFLCPLTNELKVTQVDSSSIRMNANDFVQSAVEQAFRDDSNTSRACQEIVTACYDRKSILIFSSGVDHAEDIQKEIQRLTGDEVGLVTGDTFAMTRDQHLADFKRGTLRWLVNCDVLTTGFDAPRIDAIAILRMTMSPGLFCQMVGRGLRLHEQKRDCLILDFGENLIRHGSIDDPNFGRSSPQGRGGKQGEVSEKNGRGKECFGCGQDVAGNAKSCPDCGFIFPVKHEAQADTSSAIFGGMEPAEPINWDVTGCHWSRSQNRKDSTKPPTLKVSYTCKPEDEEGNLISEQVSEWVCFEHPEGNFAREKAEQWWELRSSEPVPDLVDDAVSLMDQGACRVPSKLTTLKEHGDFFTRILKTEFTDEIPEFDGVSTGFNFSFGDDDLPF